jgi:hypothetical protein
MADNIELITRYSSKAWDRVYKREAMSSLFDAQPGMFEFTGDKTVRIARYASGGLSNYNRANQTATGNYTQGNTFGYQTSDLALIWEDFTISCDRAAKFQVDAANNEETNGLAVGAAVTETSRTVLVPEVDAYCFSKIAEYAGLTAYGRIALAGVVPGTSTVCEKPLEAINNALTYFDIHEVPADNQIIFVSPDYLSQLRNDNTEMTRFLSQADYDKSVSFKMTEYEGRKLVVVPPQRFHTNITLFNGGYAFSGGLPIDFMVVAKDAIVHIVKYNKIKVISGDLNLAGSNFDGYSIYTHIYHDLFVAQNKRVAIYVHTGGMTATTGYTPDFTVISNGNPYINLTVSGGKITDFSVLPANVMIASVQTAASNATAPAIGQTLPSTGYSAVVAGTTTYTASNFFAAVDTNNTVIAVAVIATGA